MAINDTLASSIANAIADSSTVSFSTKYLGLRDASGGEISYPEYHRVDITAKGIEGKLIMGEAAADDEGVITVENQEIIFFPENETGETVTVGGWGLYSGKTGGIPQMWGTFTKDGEPVTQEIKVGGIPIFRISDFKIKVK